MASSGELRAYATAHGVDLVGCTSASPFMVGPQQRRVDPRSFLPDAESVVVAACYTYGFETCEQSVPGAPRGRFGPWTRASLAASHYGQEVLKGFLEGQGYGVALTNEIPYKMAAVRSGIACYGKNCIVHADGFGSYLEPAAVVTNAKLDCTDQPIESSDCGSCTACVEACPAQALVRPYQLDVDRCICGWLWGRPIPRDQREKVGRYIFRCGYCQDACPKNQQLKPRASFPFELEDKRDRPELIPLLLGDRDTLCSALPSFVMEAGLDNIRRNVAIALGNSGDAAAVPALIEAIQFDPPRVRAAAAWALGRLGGAQAEQALQKARNSEADQKVHEETEVALGDRGRLTRAVGAAENPIQIDANSAASRLVLKKAEEKLRERQGNALEEP
jgi:epoxyqueuosine reductase